MELLGGSFLTLLCSLRVGCAHGCVAVFMRGQKTDRMFMLPLGLVRAQRVYYHKKKVYPLYARTMLAVAETRGHLPYRCPRPKKFTRLATRDTLHGSRPNLRQGPNGRIAPTPPNVTDTLARARRDVPEGKKNAILRIHTYILQKL